MNKIINVTTDFTEHPFGRYRSDGDRSAEVFREDKLIPALNKYEHVVVDLSGYNYYGSSFLEETFGGLVRRGFTPADLKDKLEVIHNLLPSIVAEINSYIKKAGIRETGTH